MYVFRQVKTYDIAVLMLLLSCGIWFILDASYFGRPLEAPGGYDLHSYIKLAENPLAFFDKTIPGHHAQRLFGTTLVWMINSIFGFSIDTGFRIVSGIAYLAFIVLFYSILRYQKVNIIVAFSTTALTAIASWPMTYSLSNIYQVCDALSYPLILLIIFFTIRGNSGALFLVSIIAGLNRQTLLVLAVLAHFSLYLRNIKEVKNIIYISVLSALFVVTAFFAGRGQSLKLVNDLTVGTYFHFNYMLIAASDWRVWTLFSPFLLVYINTRFIDYIKDYWWVFIYILLTIVGGFGWYYSTNFWDSLGRLIMPGIMPLFLFAGLLLNEIFKNKIILMIYGFLPFAYGINHLSFLQHTYPSLLGHRCVSIFVIYFLMLLSWKYNSKVIVSER